MNVVIMKRIIDLTLCGFLLFNIIGCDVKEENNELITTSTIIVTTSDNMIVAGNSYTEYQDDYSKTLEMIYESKTIKSIVFTEYGIEDVPEVSSINKKNTMYEVKLECWKIDIENCIAAHNLYNLKMIESAKDLFQLTIDEVAPAT